MENLIVTLILCAIVGAAGRYLYKARKKGAACIGCSCSGSCGGKQRCCGQAEK